MSSMKYPVFLYVSACFALADSIEKTSDNFGPYTVKWEYYNTCRGPKLINLTTYTTTLMKDSKEYIGAINMTFLDQTKIDEIKMSVYSTKGERKLLLWNYMINKPCQHYVMSKILETYVGTQNCVVMKGTYSCELNFTDVIHNYLGTSFFYGEFVFKVIALSKKGNILCLMFNPIFKKKL